MIYTVFTLGLMLTAFLIAQGYTIKKYKKLTKDEMSYVAMLTHDLKSPAYAQINALNLLMKGYFGQLNPKQYEIVKLTCSSSKYMSNLVGSVLAGYKYSCGPLKINKSEFDIINLVNSLISCYELLADAKNLKIIFNHSEDFYMVYGDKLQIERVISNLLSNAITYCFENTTIEINVIRQNNVIDLSISNMSNPICDNEIKNIFNKFAKTKNTKMNTNSTGIGLYTAKKIIDSHNGKIYARSSSEGLCTFGFRLFSNNNALSLVEK